MYRFLLTRRWLGLLALALAVAAACVLLGRWQLHRLEARHAKNHVITSNAAARPVPPDSLMSSHRGPARDDQYARVRVTGRYDPAHQLLVRNRPFEGANGYYVLVPLVHRRGPALLVEPRLGVRGRVSHRRAAGARGADRRGHRRRPGSVPASRRPPPARRRGAR